MEERPGGEVERIDGSRFLGLSAVNEGNGSLVTSRWFGRRIGGSSIEDLIAFVCASESDIQSCGSQYLILGHEDCLDIRLLIPSRALFYGYAAGRELQQH